MLVIFVSLICEWLVAGDTAVVAWVSPAQWIVLFAYNFDHTAVTAELYRPTPLYFFWSLAVEEQFYLVYPAILIVTGLFASFRSWRARLNTVLIAVVAVSFSWCVVSSGVANFTAYTSTFTRSGS